MEYDSAMRQLQREIQKLHVNNVITDVALSADALSSVFLEHQDKSRNLAYYMVLTSDHECHEDLMDDRVVGFLMLNSPVILKMNWTVSVLLKLKLEYCILQIIEYGPVGVVNRLLSEVDELHKEKNVAITAAIASKIARLHCRQRHSAIPTMKKHLLFCFKYFKDILHEGFSKSLFNDCGKNIDSCLQFLISFMCKCFDGNQNMCEQEVMYSIGGEYEKEDTDVEVIDTIEKVLQLWLHALENALKNISCDVWICWGEQETLPNFQTTIGNQIFILHNLLLEHKVNISEQLLQCFQHTSIKPVTEEDEILASSLSEVVAQVIQEKSAITKKWYGSLCERKDTWEDPMIVCTVLSKLRLAQNPRDIILKSMELLLSARNVELRKTFFNALKSSECLLQIEILEKLTDDKYVADFYTSESKFRIITVFNKFSTDSSNDELQELIELVIECPTCVIQNVFQLAATSKENHDLCEKIFQFLNPALRITTFYDDETSEKVSNVNILNHVFGKILRASHLDKEWHNLVLFLTKDFTKPSTFLSDCLICTLEDKLSRQDWYGSKYAVMMLRSIIHQEMVGNSIHVLTAFIGQVLVRCSWDARTFEAAKAEVYKTCCEIVLDLNLREMDSEWLGKSLSRLPNFIQTHFCDLWLGKDQICPKPSKPFLCLLIAARTKSIQVQSAMRKHFLNGSCIRCEHRIFAALFKILPILHCDEWSGIFKVSCQLLSDAGEGSIKLNVFKIFARAVIAFSMCWDLETAGCVEYCVQNLCKLFNTILDEEQWPLEERLCMFKLLVQPLENVSVVVKDGCYFLMLPVLLKCVKINGDNEDGDVFLPFLNSVDETWRDKFREALKTPWNPNSPVES